MSDSNQMPNQNPSNPGQQRPDQANPGKPAGEPGSPDQARPASRPDAIPMPDKSGPAGGK